MIDAVLDNLEEKNIDALPVFPYSKRPEDMEWQKKDYPRQRFAQDNNVGANLKKSNLVHFDFETPVACTIGGKFLPKNTFIIGKNIKRTDKKKDLLRIIFI